MALDHAKRVRIYVNEGDKIGHRPAPMALLEWLRRESAQGATVFRASAGFGAAGAIHVPHLVDVAQDLPVLVEWIDSPEQVERLLPRLKQIVPRGLVTIEDVEIVMHEPHPVRDLPVALTAADVMSRSVTAVARDAPLKEVVDLVLGKLYRALPVVDGGVPVGIITDGDLVRRGGLPVRVDLMKALERPELRAALDGVDVSGKTAADVMTPAPVTVEAATPLPRVADLMTHRRLQRLPVVDEGGKLVGIVSRVDLLRTAAGAFERKEPIPRELGLKSDVPLASVMRRDVPTVHPDTPLPEVFQAIISTRLSRALVVDAERRLLGLVTDAELLDRLTPSLRPTALRSLLNRIPFVQPKSDPEAEQHARARRAADLMTRDVPSATEETLLGDAIALMLKGNHKVLAVVGAGGRLVGIVDRADLMHGLAQPQ